MSAFVFLTEKPYFAASLSISLSGIDVMTGLSATSSSYIAIIPSVRREYTGLSLPFAYATSASEVNVIKVPKSRANIENIRMVRIVFFIVFRVCGRSEFMPATKY